MARRLLNIILTPFTHSSCQTGESGLLSTEGSVIHLLLTKHKTRLRVFTGVCFHATSFVLYKRLCHSPLHVVHVLF